MPTNPKDYDPVASIRYGTEDVKGSLSPGKWSYEVSEIEKRARMAHRSHATVEDQGTWASCSNIICEEWQAVYDKTPSVRNW